MKLKTNIFIGYFIISFLMSSVILWAVLNFYSLGQTTDSILRENYRSILAAENMQNILHIQIINLIVKGENAKNISGFSDEDALFIQWLSRAKDNITILGEKELVKEIDSLYKLYRSSFFVLLYNSEERDISDSFSVSYIRDTLIPQYSKITSKCLDLKTLNESTMYSTNSIAIQNTKRAVYSTSIIAFIVIVIVLIFSQALAVRIIKPVKILMDASKKISSGDYTIRISELHSGELENLATEFNNMAERLENYNNININQIISEKNKGEAIISSIADGLIVFDMNSIVVSINPVARRILGLGFVDLSGLKCRDLSIGDDICKVIEAISETGNIDDSPDERRIISIPKNGTLNYYIYTANLIYGRNKNPFGIVLLLKNITELREVEQMKNEFIMAASHELKTPLTSVLMSIELLYESLNSEIPDKEKEILSVARDEIYRMKSLINDLLELSSLESGKITMKFEFISIKIIFEKIYSVFAKQADIKKINLKYEFEDELPEINIDVNKISWVLSNLISNAMRYVTNNGQITYKAKRVGDFIHFSVRDNGRGIPEEDQTKIFEKFIQVKGDNSGGSGLGLAICKEIVQAHGGSIWVESKVDKGSDFKFTIPVK